MLGLAYTFTLLFLFPYVVEAGATSGHRGLRNYAISLVITLLPTLAAAGVFGITRIFG